MTPRELALDVLVKCETKGQYSNLALDAALQRAHPSDADRGLVTTLVYGVLEKRLTLDHTIERLSKRPLSEIDGRLHTLLQMGLYQLAYLDRVPDHAAVNETVELAGKRGGGFVNAILRAFIRQGKKMLLPTEEEVGLAASLSVRHSVGLPLCQRLLSSLGEETTRDYLASLDAPPSITLRVNTQRIDRDRLLTALREAGYAAEPTPLAKSGIRLNAGASVTSLPGFFEGWFFVQDEASQLSVEAVDARRGMRVLDTCACPGSKSFGMAMDMENEGELIACDLHASKLSLILSGAERLGLTCLSVLEKDARAEASDWITEAGEGVFDRILCDVPCSGFGVLGKKPELRYKDPKESEALPAIQGAILARASSFLKHGGRLVYSTCTILPEENEGVIRRFLEGHTGYRLVKQTTLYPHTHATDGFFIAVIEKTEGGC